MYKREEGVNHEVDGVWLQIRFLLFVFSSLVLFCIYKAEEHTRHASMCFTVSVERVLPPYKDTQGHTHKPKDINRHKSAGNRVT